MESIDLIKYSKETTDHLIQYIQDYCSDKTTTRLLINGVVVLLSTSILKSWLNALNERRKSGLGGPIPLPIFGNTLDVFIKGITKSNQDLVKKYGKTCVSFEGMYPTIMTADEELIKAITIRDFKKFYNRNNFGMDNIVPMDKMLITVTDEDWKRLRAIITSGFTATKMKNMTGCIKKTSDSFLTHLDGLIAKNEDLDAKKMMTNFTVDIVCSTFFGVDVNTMSDSNHPLPKHISSVMNDLTFGDGGWKLLFLLMFPKAAQYMMEKNWFTLFKGDSIEYLTSLSNQIIEERRSKRTVRNDYIQMMVDHEETEEDIAESNKKDKDKTHLKKTLTNAEILSQSILFMMVGSDTTASTLTWITHNLAMYPECQDKLIEEVDSVNEQHNGEINYDTINDMPYMSSVISETQRMYTVNFTDRVTSEDCECNGIKFKKGQTVNILLYAMTHDEITFPEPYKFIPERERPTDKFMPFGNGPRSCVAQRFALLEIKFLLTMILSKYRFEKCDKTIEKPIIDDSLLSRPKDDIFVRVVKRN